VSVAADVQINKHDVAVGDMLGVDGDPNATDSSALLRKIGTTG